MFSLHGDLVLKTIRYTLIALLIGTFVGITATLLIDQFPKITSLSNQSEIYTMSGFGKIVIGDQQSLLQNPDLVFYDESLGFAISRPNLSWTFDDDMSSVWDMIYDTDENSMARGFLGGVFVEENDDKTFFVGVFDILDDFDMDNYVNSQTDFVLERYSATVLVSEIDDDGRWAIFGIMADSKKGPIYGEQILEVHDNKLYMIQYTGIPPDHLDHKKREDLRQIIDSFTIL